MDPILDTAPIYFFPFVFFLWNRVLIIVKDGAPCPWVGMTACLCCVTSSSPGCLRGWGGATYKAWMSIPFLYLCSLTEWYFMLCFIATCLTVIFTPNQHCTLLQGDNTSAFSSTATGSALRLWQVSYLPGSFSISKPMKDASGTQGWSRTLTSRTELCHCCTPQHHIKRALSRNKFPIHVGLLVYAISPTGTPACPKGRRPCLVLVLYYKRGWKSNEWKHSGNQLQNYVNEF